MTKTVGAANDALNGFVEFDRKQSMTLRRPSVTVTRGGSLSFNRNVTDFIKKFTYVKFYFNVAEKKIAIRPISEAVENSYRLRFGSGVSQVSARAVLRDYDVDYSKAAVAYAAELDLKNGLVIIDLKQRLREIPVLRGRAKMGKAK